MWTSSVFQDAPASPCPECLHLCDWTLLVRDTNTCAASALALQSIEYSDLICVVRSNSIIDGGITE